jgi:hypothetical protein
VAKSVSEPLVQRKEKSTPAEQLLKSPTEMLSPVASEKPRESLEETTAAFFRAIEFEGMTPALLWEVVSTISELFPDAAGLRLSQSQLDQLLLIAIRGLDDKSHSIIALLLRLGADPRAADAIAGGKGSLVQSLLQRIPPPIPLLRVLFSHQAYLVEALAGGSAMILLLLRALNEDHPGCIEALDLLVHVGVSLEGNVRFLVVMYCCSSGTHTNGCRLRSPCRRKSVGALREARHAARLHVSH